ncbi:MAG: hypothetical protein JO170_12555 [Verrucomicrobia bacterium]|nr:hypothetical protein [Verrucomicrobiota bacterium]
MPEFYERDQQWRKRLRAHDLKLLAMIGAAFLAYFAALIALCYFTMQSDTYSIEQSLRKSGHWHE